MRTAQIDCDRHGLDKVNIRLTTAFGDNKTAIVFFIQPFIQPRNIHRQAINLCNGAIPLAQPTLNDSDIKKIVDFVLNTDASKTEITEGKRTDNEFRQSLIDGVKFVLADAYNPHWAAAESEQEKILACQRDTYLSLLESNLDNIENTVKSCRKMLGEAKT